MRDRFANGESVMYSYYFYLLSTLSRLESLSKRRKGRDDPRISVAKEICGGLMMHWGNEHQ